MNTETNPSTLLAPLFTQRPNRIEANIPFAEYVALGGINASILKEPTTIQMLAKFEAFAGLSPDDVRLLEYGDADATDAIERVFELTPRTVPRNFARLVRPAGPDEKPTEGQRTVLTAVAAGEVDARDLNANSLKSCRTRGWVEFVSREVEESRMSEQMLNSRALALATGDAIHKAVLEPHHFDAGEWQKHWVLSPTQSLVSEAALEVQREAEGRRLITPEIINVARRSRDAVFRHKEACELLTLPGASEISGEFWDGEVGIMRKFRLDRLPDDTNAPVLELKSTHSSLLEQPFKGEVYKRGYGIQVAYYVDGLSALNDPRPMAKMIAVTKCAPFMARVFEFNETIAEASHITRGRSIYQERLAAFVLAYHEKNWEAYENESPTPVLTT